MQIQNGTSPSNENVVSIIDLLSSKGRVKILYLLAKYNELNITQIVKMTKMNSTQVNTHLKYFVNNKVIEEKKFGRVKIYRLMTEYYKIKLLQTFFTHWD
ncbi:MAG: winged helix-turn-helix domain-containing protein [Candidatus Helarchaeota archaeon]